MRKDYIIIVPNETELANLNPQVQEIIQQLDAVWPSFPMISSQVSGANKLIHVNMSGAFSKQQLEDMFMYFGLVWEILSIREASPTLPVLDADGNITGYIYEQEYLADKAKFIPFFPDATLTEPLYLSCYAGTEPLQL
jgi:hypothetical protein